MRQYAYIPYDKGPETPPPLQYRYESPELPGEETEFTLSLSAMERGDKIFNPGSKVVHASIQSSRVKTRRQYKIALNKLSGLYKKAGYEFESNVSARPSAACQYQKLTLRKFYIAEIRQETTLGVYLPSYCYFNRLLLYSATMRTCLSFILAIMLSLNAAYAASLGACDALEHTSSHAAHFGHHSYEDSDDNVHVHDELAVDAGEVGNAAMADHYHTHVHPSFSYLLPDTIGVTPPEGCSLLVADPASTFVSAQQALLDRPPRATLA